jgi:peptidoglycan/xylan/chitin deacetylase (PgdA/CDA1 family)
VKRFVIFSISASFFAMCWMRDLFVRLVGRERPGRCVVLYYHAVPENRRAQFEKQMDDVVRLVEPAPADRTWPLPAGKHYAVVTFDDGYRNILTNALPLLKAKGIPSTIFIVPGMLGLCPELRDKSTHSVEDRMVMSMEELQEIASDLVTVGSHSLTHPFLPRLTAKEARCELSESRRLLETILQKPVRLFCFPYGACNEELFCLCHEAGYERVFTALPQWKISNASEFVTGRVRVDPTDWRLEFRLKLLGAYRWLPMAVEMKRRILRKHAETPISHAIAPNL